jgi:hypothetical protein
MGDRWDFGAGEHQIGAGVGGRPCLDACAWPGPATGDGGLRGWELGVGGSQVQDLPTGDTKQTGGFGGGKKLRGLHHGLFLFVLSRARWQSYLSSVVFMISQPGEHAGAESS